MPEPGKLRDHIKFLSYCATGANRALVTAGALDILPVHYSELPEFLERRVDVLLLAVSPADEAGLHSLGMSCEYLVPLIRSARVVVAEINDLVPFTFGDTYVRSIDIDYAVHTSRALPTWPEPRPGPAEETIAYHVAGLVEDGAVLQVGLGAVPESILKALKGHRDLGIHSGLMTDGLLDLVESGSVTNARKEIDTGISVAGLLAGTTRLASFAHRNPKLALRATSYTHDVEVISQLERFAAVNSAVEVDLTGQINSEVAQGRYVGAVGGAVDFIRGAHKSRGGLPLTVLPSTARGAKGTVSRIVVELTGPVSTSRADAGIIVTEHGVADLRGLSLEERRSRMIAVAAPQFREDLSRGLRPGGARGPNLGSAAV